MKPVLWVQSNHIDLVRQTGVHMIRASNDQHDADYVPLYDSETVERLREENEKLRGLLQEAVAELKFWKYKPIDNDPLIARITAAIERTEEK